MTIELPDSKSIIMTSSSHKCANISSEQCPCINLAFAMFFLYAISKYWITLSLDYCLIVTTFWGSPFQTIKPICGNIIICTYGILIKRYILTPTLTWIKFKIQTLMCQLFHSVEFSAINYILVHLLYASWIMLWLNILVLLHT